MPEPIFFKVSSTVMTIEELDASKLHFDSVSKYGNYWLVCVNV